VVTGHVIDYVRHCKYEFGEYVQVHEEHDNSMSSRTVGALAMRPTGNAQGNWYFMSLSTGRILNRTHGTKLPMPDEVIERVHNLARRQKANPGLVFTNRADQITVDEYEEFDDDESQDDETYEPSDDDDDSDDDDGSEDDDNGDSDDDGDAAHYYDDDGGDIADDHGGVDDDGPSDDKADDEVADDDVDINVDMHAAQDEEVDADVTGVDTAEDSEIIPGVQAAEDGTEEERDGMDADDDGTTHSAIESEMDAKYGARTGTYNLRPRKWPQYNFAIASVTKENLATPQMLIHQGLKIFGNEGVRAVKKELLQVHERSAIKPRIASELTPSQKKEALAYLMFLKRK
jgi:hypothetical protein